MDIGFRMGYPSSDLSNFASHSFVFDEVECASMEGLLQSLKFKTPAIQAKVCQLAGIAAKSKGQSRNVAWKKHQTLWWQGASYPRGSKAYQILLDRAFDALAHNANFQKALIASGEFTLTHAIGRKKRTETVLTRSEFCSRLMKIRERLKTTGL